MKNKISGLWSYLFSPKKPGLSFSTFQIINPDEKEATEVAISLDNLSLKETEEMLMQNLKALNLSQNHCLFELEPSNLSSVSLSKFIVILDLSYCSIGSKALLFLPSLLKDNDTLLSLDISNNNLESNALSLLFNSTLKRLDIHSNDLSDLIAEHIVKNLSLEYLDISFNKLSDLGAITLLASEFLKFLNISNNQITSDGAKAFLVSDLKKVFINNNSMSQKEEDDFFFAFYDNPIRAELLSNDALSAINFALEWPT